MGRWIWVMFLNFCCFAIMRVKNKVPPLQSPCERSDSYTLLINGLFRGKKVTFYDRHCGVVSDACSQGGGFRKPFLPRSCSGYGLHVTVWRAEWGRPSNYFRKQMKSCNKRPLGSRPLKQICFPPNGWVGWNNRYFYGEF